MKTISLFGFQVMLDPLDTLCLSSGNNWEPHNVKIIMENLKPGDIAIDAGAHIGYYTLLMAKIVGESGHVYSFEPNPDIYQILEWNVKSNNLGNVTVFNKALSNEKNSIKLFKNPGNTGDTRIWTPRESGMVEADTVETVRLDDILDCEPAFIKMDTQGSEYKIILGGRRVLSTSKVKLIVEYTPTFIADQGEDPLILKRLLEELGFKTMIIGETLRPLNDEDVKRLVGSSSYYDVYCYKD